MKIDISGFTKEAVIAALFNHIIELCVFPHLHKLPTMTEEKVKAIIGRHGYDINNIHCFDDVPLNIRFDKEGYLDGSGYDDKFGTGRCQKAINELCTYARARQSLLEVSFKHSNENLNKDISPQEQSIRSIFGPGAIFSEPSTIVHIVTGIMTEGRINSLMSGSSREDIQKVHAFLEEWKSGQYQQEFKDVIDAIYQEMGIEGSPPYPPSFQSMQIPAAQPAFVEALRPKMENKGERSQ